MLDGKVRMIKQETRQKFQDWLNAFEKLESSQVKAESKAWIKALVDILAEAEKEMKVINYDK